MLHDSAIHTNKHACMRIRQQHMGIIMIKGQNYHTHSNDILVFIVVCANFFADKVKQDICIRIAIKKIDIINTNLGFEGNEATRV